MVMCLAVFAVTTAPSCSPPAAALRAARGFSTAATGAGAPGSAPTEGRSLRTPGADRGIPGEIAHLDVRARGRCRWRRRGPKGTLRARDRSWAVLRQNHHLIRAGQDRVRGHERAPVSDHTDERKATGNACTAAIREPQAPDVPRHRVVTVAMMRRGPRAGPAGPESASRTKSAAFRPERPYDALRRSRSIAWCRSQSA